MDHFSRRKNILSSLRRIIHAGRAPENAGPDPDKVLTCKHCGGVSSLRELRKDLFVCPHCGSHSRISARKRIRFTADEGTFRETNAALSASDPLDFPGYRDKLEETRGRTGLKEAVVTGTCRIDGIKVMLCVMDGRFMMASMGIAVGEKITRAFEYAASRRIPVIVFAASGGARMQEGILSLMQMAKTSAAVAKHSEAGLLFVSVLTNPTTGGVTASFASLGDIMIAEPGALIGFAGPRVIEQTINEKLPEGFQSAEFQLEHGMVDAVVSRKDLRSTLALILRLHQKGKK